MAVGVPPSVAETAELFDLGGLLGRRRQSADRARRAALRERAVICGLVALFLLLSAIATASAFSWLIVLLVGSPLLAVAWTGLGNARRIVPSEIFLYRRGVVLTSERVQVAFAERWENLQLTYRMPSEAPGQAGSRLPDGFALFSKGNMVLRQTERINSRSGRGSRSGKNGGKSSKTGGSGACRTVVRLSQEARTPVLLNRLRAGQTVSFGLLSATAQGLIHEGRVIPWRAVVAVGVGYPKTMIAMADGPYITLRTDWIRDLAVLSTFVDRAQADDAYFAPVGSPPADGRTVDVTKPDRGEFTPFTFPRNAHAIAGVVFAVLLWPIGLVLSFSGLRSSLEPGATGRVVAAVGVAVAVLVGILSLVITISGISDADTSNAMPPYGVSAGRF